MPPDIHKEHAVETYKSLIQISVEGMKLLALLNGGAAVALLAYLGNVASKCGPVPDMRFSMIYFLAGLVLCGLCFVTSYLTQLALYNEAIGPPPKMFYQKHQWWLWFAMFFVLASIGAFACGSYEAVANFR